MMDLRLTPIVHRASAIALLLMTLAGFWLLVLAPLATHVGNLREQIDTQRVVLGRLHAYSAKRDEIERIARESTAGSDDQMFLEGKTDALKVAALQSTLAGFLARSGGQLRSTRSLGVSDRDGVRLIGVEIQLGGFTEHLQELLLSIERSRPLMLVDQLEVNAIPPRGEGARHGRLAVKIDVYAPVRSESE